MFVVNAVGEKWLALEVIKAQIQGISHPDAVLVQRLLVMCDKSGYGDAEQMLEGIALQATHNSLDHVLLSTLILALPVIIEVESRPQCTQEQPDASQNPPDH